MIVIIWAITLKSAVDHCCERNGSVYGYVINIYGIWRVPEYFLSLVSCLGQYYVGNWGWFSDTSGCIKSSLFFHWHFKK